MVCGELMGDVEGKGEEGGEGGREGEGMKGRIRDGKRERMRGEKSR